MAQWRVRAVPQKTTPTPAWKPLTRAAQALTPRSLGDHRQRRSGIKSDCLSQELQDAHTVLAALDGAHNVWPCPIRSATSCGLRSARRRRFFSNRRKISCRGDPSSLIGANHAFE
jgi:hypothetical protein